MPEPSQLRIREILDPRRIRLDVQRGSKRDILTALVAPLSATHRSIDPEALIRSLLEREETSTTAIADGIAIPHGRHSVGDQVVCCFGRSDEGVDFASVDGSPTHLFFVLISPESQPSLHLRWLAHLAVLLRDVHLRDSLRSALTAEGVLESLEKAETAQAQGNPVL
jgi:mannitol/fructose-specific phosphotransferase system IIA component (Ntr-type)